MGLIIFAMLLITSIIVIKYSPIYVVSYNGEKIGYIRSKKELENIIQNKILISDNPNALFTTLNSEIKYEFKLANIEKTNEGEIIEILSGDTTTMYKVYAINLNNELKAYVNTWEEAEEIVTQMKDEYSEIVNVEISVTEKYTNNINDLGVLELADAKTEINSDLRALKSEQERIAGATCNGVYLSVKPVSGTITSRYGAVESVRNHTHAGLDIAAPAGTSIKAAAGGTISYAGWMSGYGNLIIINHENEVQTYYGHCSRLFFTTGENVEAGDVIAAVGSTGNSTGNHLHFEIRVNGQKVNPQKYLYK